MFTLVAKGQSDVTLVLAPGLGSPVTEAVADLTRVVEQMSGAKIPVQTDGDAAPEGPQIHIGPTEWVQDAGLFVADLPVNGYRLVTVKQDDGARLAVAASHPLGITHGIYALLTDELGVLWGMADPLFEDIPSRDTVEVGELDRTEYPAFGFRVFSGVDPAWLRRNRMDDGQRSLPFYGHGHNLFNIFPPSKYRDHPEYYAMRDGERQVPEQDGHTPIQPCLTNPEAIRITIETVSGFFDANPSFTTYSLCPNDSAGFCECPSCRALDDGMPEYRGRRINSDSYFHYIDVVARALLQTHPDRYVSAYAYWTTELPPRRIDRLPSNVVIYLTQDSSQYYDPTYEERDHDILKRWSQVAHHLAMYDYYGLGWWTPRVFSGIVTRTLRYLPTVRVKGFYCEAYPYWAHMGPQLYLATRLLWDPALDAEALLDEWCRRMFREVAHEMRSYFDTLERGWTEQQREGRWFLGLNRLYVQLAEWPSAMRDEAWRHIEMAQESATDPLIRSRVAYVRTGHRLAHLFSKTVEDALALRRDPRNLEAEMRRLLDRVEEAMMLFHEQVESDLSYGSAYYRGERADIQIGWWKAYLISIIEELLADEPSLHGQFANGDLYREMLEARHIPGVSQRIEECRQQGFQQTV